MIRSTPLPRRHRNSETTHVTSAKHGESDNTVWRPRVDLSVNGFVPPRAASRLVAIPPQAYVIPVWLISPRSRLTTNYGSNIGLISNFAAHVCLCEIYTRLPPSHETYLWLCQTCISAEDYYDTILD